MKFFDNHTHLQDQAFQGQEALYLQNAASLGVSGMITVGQDLDFNQKAISLADKFSNVYAMVGYCPDVAKDVDAKQLDLLLEQLRQPKVVALGEIGLDYYWDESPRDVQRAVFAEQIELAQQVKKPINVHTREAFADTYQILRQANLKYGCVLHNFNGNPDWAEKFLDLGCYLSLSGVVSFAKASDVHATAKMVPLTRLLIETDAPYLTPKPYRGQQNQPAYVRFTAEAIAHLRKAPLKAIAQASYRNAMNVYGIKEEF